MSAGLYVRTDIMNVKFLFKHKTLTFLTTTTLTMSCHLPSWSSYMYEYKIRNVGDCSKRPCHPVLVIKYCRLNIGTVRVIIQQWVCLMLYEGIYVSYERNINFFSLSVIFAVWFHCFTAPPPTSPANTVLPSPYSPMTLASRGCNSVLLARVVITWFLVCNAVSSFLSDD
jgi:hypothetical protein